MIVLGIDPGTAITGYGAVSLDHGRLTPIEFGVIRTAAHSAVTDRLLTIHHSIADCIRRVSPDIVAIERVFFNHNVQSALAVGQASGAAVVTAASAGVTVRMFTPPEVKAAVTGYGGAGKSQVQAMVRVLLGLDEPPKPDDVADALAVAICCLHGETLRSRLEAGS